MAFETRVTVYPDIPVQPHGGGGFTPSSFQDLLHLKIHLPGLDPSWDHTLIAVAVAADYNSAELTLRSEPLSAKSLDRGLRVESWLPAARIKAYSPDGTELAISAQNAPLQLGERVEVGGTSYMVVAIDWPHRDAETGACQGEIDWQHVTVIPDPMSTAGQPIRADQPTGVDQSSGVDATEDRGNA